MKRKVGIITLLISILVVGIFIGKQTSTPTPTPVEKVVSKPENTPKPLTNPLLNCDQGQCFHKTQLQGLHDSVTTLVNKKIKNGDATKIAVYYKDLNTDARFILNQQEKFIPASLLKVPIMIMYYSMAEDNPATLTKKFTFENLEDNNQYENIKPTKQIEKGKSYTVEELLRYMIVYSDNNAKNLLLIHLDKKQFNKVFEDLGLTPPSYDDINYLVAIQDIARFLQVLYNASYLSNTYSQKALDLLSAIDFKGGIRAQLPKDIIVADKFGESISPNGENQLHDCGIVYYPYKPYILCIFSRGNNMQKLSSVIEAISKDVYDEIDHQTSPTP